MTGMVLSNIPQDLMDLNIVETEARCHIMRSIISSHKFNKTEWHLYKHKPTDRESENSCKNQDQQTDNSSTGIYLLHKFHIYSLSSKNCLLGGTVVKNKM